MNLFAQRVKLALADTARRSGFRLAAALILALAAGFFLAALWSWLAHGLGWGPVAASLLIGGLLVLIAAILLAMASRQRHPMPTGDDLKHEVEMQVSRATSAAVTRASSEAARMADKASHKVHSLMDQAGSRVTNLASDAAHRAGLSDAQIASARQAAQNMTHKAGAAARSNPGSMAKLAAAFAIGVALATRLRDRRREDDVDEFDDFMDEIHDGSSR